MRSITYGEAVREALVEEMRRDERVLLYGEDVAVYGGIFGFLAGLQDEFGERVFDTPISENLIAGSAVGAAMAGMRPVAELQFADFILCAADEVFFKAGAWRYVHDGAFRLPLVIRAPAGGYGFGAEHSQCPEAYAMHTPGLRVCVPSTAADAKGLLKTAIRSDDPIVFLEHKLLYGTKGEVPEEEHLTPFGQAVVHREGSALTIIAWQEMLRRSLEAAGRLDEEGVDVEVLDPRTLNPLDLEAILASVRKTGACLIVEEGFRTLGVGAEIGALLMEHAFGELDRPLRRLAMADVPVPTAAHLWEAAAPGVDDIVRAAREIAE